MAPLASPSIALPRWRGDHDNGEDPVEHLRNLAGDLGGHTFATTKLQNHNAFKGPWEGTKRIDRWMVPMRNISIFLPVLVSFLFTGCDQFNDFYPPKYRVQNYCDYTVDFQIIPAGADTIRVNNVPNNASGNFAEIKAGNVHVIGSVPDLSETYTYDFVAENNYGYSITMHDGAVFGQHVIHLEVTRNGY